MCSWFSYQTLRQNDSLSAYGAPAVIFSRLEESNALGSADATTYAKK